MIQELELMESWSHGPQPSITPILHYSSLSEPPFFLQLFDNAFVHQVLGSEAPNLFVASAQEADDVANAVDAGIDLSLKSSINIVKIHPPPLKLLTPRLFPLNSAGQIGRASCRERV